MKNSAPILVCIAISICILAAHAESDEDQGRRIAEAAIKTGAIDYLTDRDFKLDGPRINVTARAIEPKEHVKIELKEFKLLPGRADLKFTVDAPFRFEGTITSDDTQHDVRGKGNIVQLISLEAKYWVDQRGLQFDAKANDIEFSAKVEDLTPEDAGGGKSAFGKSIVKQLGRQKDELLRDFNQWQEAYQRKNR